MTNSEKTLNDTNPNNIFFQARLVCINTLKGEEIPTLDDIRPIAITGLMQKLIEKAILSKIGDKILSKINKAQCGFVKEKETLLHFNTVLNRLNDKQQKRSTILLFFDFKAAFDSVDFVIY